MPNIKPRGRYMTMNVFEKGEIRIAICDGDDLDGFHLERSDQQTQTGNIYKGRVEAIVPSLQAAFVNIGEKRNGFLHISDVIFPDGGYRGLLPKRKRKKTSGDKRDLTIKDVLYEGQELLVQVSKEGIGQKGCALTTYVSLPGRYLVIMPSLKKKGVSRRISDDKTRKRLKEALREISSGLDVGVIVRTAGENVGAIELKQDIRYLRTLWNAICGTVKETTAPSLVYKEGDLIIRAIRDIFTDDMTACYIDESKAFSRVREFMRVLMPQAVDKIHLFDNRVPIFDYFGIEEEVAKLARRKINLPRGASIVVDQTEALVAIDVNSGKLKEGSFGETLLQTNLLAAKEIARQIRLRDLAGLIVIDFVDMENSNHRERLYREFVQHLEYDKARETVGTLSEFCVMELTRQRQRPSLSRTLFRQCPTCQGKGYIEGSMTTVLNFLRLARKAMSKEGVVKVEATVHPDLALFLLNDQRREISKLEDFYNCGVSIAADSDVSIEEMQVVAYLENEEKVVIN